METGSSSERIRVRERGNATAIEARFLGVEYALDVEDASRDPVLLLDDSKHTAIIVMPASPMHLDAPDQKPSAVFWEHYRRTREPGNSEE